jgi:pyruvate dehydrogenase (quinone)
VPYAIAAKYAHPNRHVIALVGDGAMQMNGVNGLITISKVWKDWSKNGGDGRLTIMVLNNSDLNQVTWEQRAMEGDPRFMASQALPRFPYAAYADLLGLGGIRVDKPEDIAPAWDRALSSQVPTLLEVVTDPDVPPIPPHISAKQAKAYFSALWQRDPDSLGIIKASIKEVWDGLFPPAAPGS